MSTCVFCGMVRSQRISVRDLLLVSLAKDPGGRAYVTIELPACEAHDAYPVLVLRTLGERPEVQLHGPGLFTRADGAVVGPDVDLDEDGDVIEDDVDRDDAQR